MQRTTPPALAATLAFLACLALPLALTLLPQASPQPGAEAAVGAGPAGDTPAAPPLPSPANRTFPAYASALEGWVNGNFRPRSAMIRANNLARLALFGESPSRSVLKGQGRWLFYADEWELEDCQNVMPLSEAMLADMARIMEERRAWLAARGIRFYVVVAPNKSTAYADQLPASMKRRGPQSRLDQVAATLAANPGLDFLDLRGPLAEARRQQRTYDYTDTHWNAYGAFVGYREIMARAVRDFPALRPLTLADFTLEAADGPGGDLSGQLSLKADLPEERILLTPRFTPRARDAARDYPDPVGRAGRDMVVKETGNATLPRLLVFRDSFSWQLVPFLSESFASSVYVWTFDFLPWLVEREKPDLVILEAVERYVTALTLPNAFRARD